jgi:hypothetical protein
VAGSSRRILRHRDTKRPPPFHARTPFASQRYQTPFCQPLEPKAVARKLLALHAEVLMGVIRPLLQSNACCVEVSGWYEHEVFFVEKTDLDWDDLAGKHIVLQHKLTSGSIIFIRRLHSVSTQRSAAIAYVAEFIGSVDEQIHQFQFQLHPVCPRQHSSSLSIN